MNDCEWLLTALFVALVLLIGAGYWIVGLLERNEQMKFWLEEHDRTRMR